MDRLAAPAVALGLLVACATPRPGAPAGPTVPAIQPGSAAQPGAPAPPRGPAAAPRDDLEAGRAVLLGFVRAVEAGRWAEAWPLLSARWRSATSPGRLAADFRGAGPVAREAGERVVALLAAGAPLQASPGLLRLPVGAGREARLVAEPGGWRVDALE